MRRRVLACVLMMAAASTARAGAAGADKPTATPPDVKGMIEAGARTARELQTRSASWTVVCRGTAMVSDLEIKVVSDGTRRHLSFSGRNVLGALVEFADVIERDGVWYVTEAGRRGKYRPYECPFQIAPLSMLYRRAEPMVLVESARQMLVRPTSVEDGVATYMLPLDPEQRRQIEGVLRQVRTAAASGALTSDAKDKLDRQVRRLEGLLRDGRELKVDVARGLFLTCGTPQLTSEVRDFRWLDAVPAGAFDIGQDPWADHTGDPTTLDLGELAMIGHGGMWRPGMDSMDTDLRLLHLPTGTIRRIPFRGDTALAGCFVRDRHAVLVVGVDTLQGTWGLYEIDLKTGANREIGHDVLAGRMPFGPALSPDGKTIAVMRVDMGRNIFAKQICLVDLETGRGRTIGAELDAAKVCWRPDGRGLLITRIDKTPDPNEPGGRTIVRMDLDGTSADLRKGELGGVLADGRLLVQVEEGGRRSWRTCDMEGGGERPYGDGLANYGFPTVGPDGSRVLFMRFGGAAGPRPVIVEAGKVAHEVPVGPGLWTAPGWR